MESQINRLKEILSSTPYIDIDYWGETERMIGDHFLEGYTLEQLEGFKAELDDILSEKVSPSDTNSRSDIPSWADLDTKYWPEEEKRRYGVPETKDEKPE